MIQGISLLVRQHQVHRQHDEDEDQDGSLPETLMRFEDSPKETREKECDEGEYYGKDSRGLDGYGYVGKREPRA